MRPGWTDLIGNSDGGHVGAKVPCSRRFCLRVATSFVLKPDLVLSLAQLGNCAKNPQDLKT